MYAVCARTAVRIQQALRIKTLPWTAVLSDLTKKRQGRSMRHDGRSAMHDHKLRFSVGDEGVQSSDDVPQAPADNSLFTGRRSDATRRPAIDQRRHNSCRSPPSPAGRRRFHADRPPGRDLNWGAAWSPR